MLTFRVKENKEGNGMLNDEQILDLYWARDDAAIERTSEKYGGQLERLADRMLRAKEDAEECVNDTYLGAWNSIPPTRPVHFFAYLAKLCRSLICNKLDWMNAGKRRAELLPLTDELAACIPDPVSDRVLDAKELGAALSAFLRTLPQESRVIFLRRYWFFDPIGTIAEKYGFSVSKVKNMLYHSRNRLREYLRKEGVIV